VVSSAVCGVRMVSLFDEIGWLFPSTHMWVGGFTNFTSILRSIRIPSEIDLWMIYPNHYPKDGRCGSWSWLMMVFRLAPTVCALDISVEKLFSIWIHPDIDTYMSLLDPFRSRHCQCLPDPQDVFWEHNQYACILRSDRSFLVQKQTLFSNLPGYMLCSESRIQRPLEVLFYLCNVSQNVSSKKSTYAEGKNKLSMTTWLRMDRQSEYVDIQ
jgi:hypothetical protein